MRSLIIAALAMLSIAAASPTAPVEGSQVPPQPCMDPQTVSQAGVQIAGEGAISMGVKEKTAERLALLIWGDDPPKAHGFIVIVGPHTVSIFPVDGHCARPPAVLPPSVAIFTLIGGLAL